MSEASYRTILRSSSIIGGAQVINVAVSLVKMKVVAVLLGPVGVGLIGLYLNLMQTASSVAALGIGATGVRQIATASAEGGVEAVGRIRRALFWGTMVLALAGAAAFWMASGWIARVILDDESHATHVAWLSLGVALVVAAGGQSALLTGLRRVGDLARINIGAGVLGAILGVGALWIWGDDAIVATILIATLVTFLLGHIYVSRLGPPAGPRATLIEMAQEWRVMVTLGFAFMYSGLVTQAGHLAARALVQNEFGLDALGHFQASWAIGMTYLSFVLAAMGTDYYPRLTAAIGDRVTAARMVNEQTEVALLLCGPVLLGMLGLAPWVIRVLYTGDFAPAVEILRWQILGDILKVMSWPLGFILLAAGAGKTFIVTESIAMGVFVLAVYVGLPIIGVAATGVAFLAMYVVYLPLVWWLGRRRIGFRWTRAVRMQAVLVIAAAIAVELAAQWSDLAGAVVGVLLGASLGAWAMVRLASASAATGRLALLARFGDKFRTWMLKWT